MSVHAIEKFYMLISKFNYVGLLTVIYQEFLINFEVALCKHFVSFPRLDAF